MDILYLQMMSLGHGCGMIPMMFPGIQQYMPAMGIGIGMGMNPPVAPYPTATPIGPRFPMPAFPIPPFSMTDPSRIQASNQTDPMLNSPVPYNSNHPPFPTVADPCKQNLGLHQTQVTSSMVSSSSSTLLFPVEFHKFLSLLAFSSCLLNKYHLKQAHLQVLFTFKRFQQVFYQVSPETSMCTIVHSGDVWLKNLPEELKVVRNSTRGTNSEK